MLLVLIVLAGLGYAGFKYLWPSKNTSGGSPSGAQLCDIDSQSCSIIPKSTNSGALQITITSAGKPVSNLEVDVGAKPGATKYYMGLTDAGGVITIDGITAGNYVIYFNQGAFPSELTEPAPQAVGVTIGQTTKTTIDLTSK